jgi:hypothetical protein
VSRIPIKLFQERVFLGLLKQQVTAETGRESLRKTGLANADRTLDDNKFARL